MLTVGWKELLCVAVFTALVWAAHWLLRLPSPLPAPEPRPRLPGSSRDLVRAAAAVCASFVVGLILAGPLLPHVFQPPPANLDTLPVADLSFRWLYLPLLLAIFLSSPAWIALAPRDIPRSSLPPAAVFTLGGILGALVVLPNAGKGAAAVWDATLGSGLILLAGPLSFRAARSRLAFLDRPARRWVFLTPLLMLTAAVATASRAVFHMTLVFLPMCVACMAGIGVAELVSAHANGRPLAFSRIGGWGIRLMAECLLGAAVALAILFFLP